ncbi:MAG: response regulator [Planctomycetes bacterium]|nr:response regulator [Planctomycetota bacterium]
MLNVLIVDDSSTMRKMLARTLDMSGLPVGSVHTANDGQQALDALEEHWIDVVFLDINMPVMNGEEALQRIRADEAKRDVKVLVISTEGSETRIQRLLEMGAAFLRKPFRPEQLRDAVQELTGVGND